MEGSALGRVYADGEVVVRQGEPGDCMYNLQDGQLEVLASLEGRTEARIGVLEPGALFGEMAIFEHEVRSATIRALGQARVLTIDKRTFMRRVQEDPSLAFNLVKMMSHRIRQLTTQACERRSSGERRDGERRCGADRRKGSQ